MTLRDRLTQLATVRTDAARHADLTGRFPDAYVVRAQAVPEFLEQLAPFRPDYLPRRGILFSVVVDAAGISLWAGAVPATRFLLVAWPDVGEFSLHNYVDFPITDLLAVYEGHVTTMLVVPVGQLALELAIWGDPERDQTASLLDEYGVRTVLARIERLRPGRAEPEPQPDRFDERGRRIARAAPALRPVAVARTVYPRFTLRRR